jgi:chromosome segregation ATPase
MSEGNFTSVVKKVAMIVLPLFVGLAIGLVYGQARLGSSEKAHQARIKEMSQRLSQSQRKYSQEMDVQASLEQEKRRIQEEVEKLTGEKAAVSARTEDLKARVASSEAKAVELEKKNALLEARAATAETKSGHLAERLSKVEAEGAALDQKQRQTFQTLQEREKELKQINRKYDQCAESNARLYTAADELIKRYEGRGAIGKVLEKEPFTQIKRVELERLVQDYKDRIDQQKMRSK